MIGVRWSAVHQRDQRPNGQHAHLGQRLRNGRQQYPRGAWASRLETIDHSLAELEAALAAAEQDAVTPVAAGAALPVSQRRKPKASHQKPAKFVPGEALAVTWQLEDDVALEAVRLHYRPVNKALTYQTLIMEGDGRTFRTEIPASQTQTPFPLQYYFEVVATPAAWQYPGLDEDLSNQPYYVVHTDEKTAWGKR